MRQINIKRCSRRRYNVNKTMHVYITILVHTGIMYLQAGCMGAHSCHCYFIFKSNYLFVHKQLNTVGLKFIRNKPMLLKDSRVLSEFNSFVKKTKKFRGRVDPDCGSLEN